VFLIEEYKIDLFRLDHNVSAVDSMCCNECCGYLENTFARYYENVYGMYRQLRERYPKVIFENCAGGGGRTDLGMTAGFTHTWVTDWQLHPNAFRITNGMAMALPLKPIVCHCAYNSKRMGSKKRKAVFSRASSRDRVVFRPSLYYNHSATGTPSATCRAGQFCHKGDRPWKR